MLICSLPRKLLLVISFFLQLGSLILIGGCEPKKLPNGKEMAAEVERHQVKRITGPMIIQETHRVGDSILRKADQQMLQFLKNKLDSGNFEQALQYRQKMQDSAVNQMAKKYQAQVGRTGKTWPNAATDPASLLLQEQLQQYQAFQKQKQPLKPQVIRVGTTELLYTKPIFMANPLCLQCHGQPGKTLSPEEQKLLPKDFASTHAGYQTGDWAGMWYVRFKSKGILESLTQKRKRSRIAQALFGKQDSVKK
ncbi:DUF3365 domain-containing protein [Adhaeribacter swui]|uniref:DUF3365 domain-containing protein n=1 Tax=Adhaeribacter swui TaxID=2086471 RepID=A0A7G7G6K2_9BACT|nr:DUF3365 domain-containing protein [Adhaeribacter swui]QNF32786.1 DUF3365 domain-containing protein [Adhaeribacter swui]